MPTNQTNTQAKPQVSSQPRWYQYISPYIEGASETIGDINKRKDAYVKAFKDYAASAAEQAKNYGSDAMNQIERYAAQGANTAKKYGSQAVDAVKREVPKAWNATKDWVKEAAHDIEHEAKLWTIYDDQPLGIDAKPKPRPKPARPYRVETFPDPRIPINAKDLALRIALETAQPGVTYIRNLLRTFGHVVPMRKLGLTPLPDTLTNSDLGERAKYFMDSTAVSQLDLQVPDWRERTAKGDTVRIMVPASSYTDYYGWSNKGWPYRLANPQGQVEHTLGTWTVDATKDHLIHTDKYDFPKIQMQKGGGLYNIIRSLTSTDDIKPEDVTQVRIERKRIPWDEAPYKWFSGDNNIDKK